MATRVLSMVAETPEGTRAGASAIADAQASAMEAVLACTRTEQGNTLLQLAKESPLLLVFLRHFGCSYCRQALDDVARLQGPLARRGVRPVFVHLGTQERARPYFEYYGLGQVERVSDPDAMLYRSEAFALPRRHPLSHFFSPVVWRGWLMGSLRRFGIGWIREDSFQMPGVFVLRECRIVNAFQFQTIADQPDYLSLL